MGNQFEDDFFIPPGFPAFPNYPYYSEYEQIIISNANNLVKEEQAIEKEIPNEGNNESIEKL